MNFLSFQMKTVISSTPHSREPQEHSVAVTKLGATLNEHAPDSRGTLSQPLVEHTTETHVEVRAELCLRTLLHFVISHLMRSGQLVVTRNSSSSTTV